MIQSNHEAQWPHLISLIPIKSIPASKIDKFGQYQVKSDHNEAVKVIRKAVGVYLTLPHGSTWMLQSNHEAQWPYLISLIPIKPIHSIKH